MKVLFVCGKGGVGKTSISVALGQYYSRRGGSLILTLNSPQNFFKHLGQPVDGNSPVRISDNLYAGICNKPAILKDYVVKLLKLKFIGNWVVEHPLYEHLTTITPGLKEILILDHIFGFATTKYIDKWQTIIVDMPSTGHGISLLNITDIAAKTFQFGPLRQQLLTNRSKLRDPKFCRAVIVTLPEETPINESRQLITALQNQVSLAIDTVIVNQIEYLPISLDSINALSQLDDDRLSSHLTPIATINATPSTLSVRNAVDLQVKRAKTAQLVIREFRQWWQEDIVLLQKFYSGDSKEISTLIANALDVGGYCGTN